jgi:pantoate--beta-alanine ligase
MTPQVWESVGSWLPHRATLQGKSIGLVPTMGALHSGHAALVDRCRRENDVVVVTLFVNPAQFNDPKDLERYPRTFDEDLTLLTAHGADHVLAPPVADLYPQGYRYRIEPQAATAVMESAHRPGFLQGVMTVVLKLLNIVRADRAYFGEKDFQQLRTVKEMVEEFFVPTEIVACPTVRTESGLAESSRNRLLTAQGRERAAGLHRALTSAPTPAEASALLQEQGFRVEYVEEHWGRRLAAAYLEGVRLIDNVPAPR